MSNRIKCFLSAKGDFHFLFGPQEEDVRLIHSDEKVRREVRVEWDDLLLDVTAQKEVGVEIKLDTINKCMYFIVDEDVATSIWNAYIIKGWRVG